MGNCLGAEAGDEQQIQWRSGPGGMKICDTVVGKGHATPRKGTKVTVHYTGKLTNGKQFDSSVGKSPFVFTYGGGEVIKGWDMGLEGMKIGGTRELELPPEMGYGARGAPPDIPSNATLRFTIQMLKC